MYGAFEAMLQHGEHYEHLLAKLLERRGFRVLGEARFNWKTNGVRDSRTLRATHLYPDLLVERNGRARWIDAKFKTHADLYRRTQTLVTGIPMRHWLYYKEIALKTATPVAIAFLHQQENEIRSAYLTDLERCISHQSDKMSRHGMIFFVYNQIPVVGRFEELYG